MLLHSAGDASFRKQYCLWCVVVAYHLSAVSELHFMNAKQVPVRLINVCLKQLSLCCQLDVTLLFFFFKS